ncbi:MAG: AmmeMemoRadiSam system protein B [Spirochaetes bacterium]|nr:AmmeMemoRadiSam system protein B [Spirochaetota bacterium]MBU0956282.1 AmmeMemoRadiSam system protein B [Spirochaetota bacterium]
MNEVQTGVKYREAIFSGIFYPEDSQILTELIRTALAKATAARTDARALLLPHASYDYILNLLAAAWKTAQSSSRKIKNIVILADDNEEGQAAIIIPESSYFETPIGRIRVNQNLCREIEASSTLVQVDDICHMKHHSIEVQLPFIKLLFPEAAIVPILLRGTHPNLSRISARLLDLVFTDRCKNTLIAASSNISSSLVPAKAVKLADLLLHNLAERNIQGIYADRQEYESVSVSSIATLLELQCLGDASFSILDQADSKILRDNNATNIVHYATAGWF